MLFLSQISAKLLAMYKYLRLGILIIALGLLSGCNTELNAPGEKLEIKGSELKDVFINEEYSANILAIGGLTPYHFELSKGKLPEGLNLQGGTIRGIATKEGSYSFTITVSDANLSKTFYDYTLNVVVPPPAELSLNIPLTEVQRTVTIRAEIKNARSLQAFRTNISWDGELFEIIPDSLRVKNESFAILSKLDGSNLEVDIAILGTSLNGDRRIFEFELRPIKTSYLEVNFDTEFISSTGNHAYKSLIEGRTADYNYDNQEDEGNK